MKEYEFHEAANIFPLDEEHLDELAGDIRKNGQQVAIELFDGLILDGRRRYLACKKINILPRLIEVDVADPIAYVVSLNLRRRHLSPTQLSMVGAKVRDIYDRRAEEKQKTGKGADGSGGRGNKKNLEANLPQGLDRAPQSRDEVAKMVGVGGKSIDYASQVLAKDNPALIAAVESDLLAVSTAAKASLKSDAEIDAQIARAAQAKAEGRRRARPTAVQVKEEELESNGKRKSLGVGMDRAQEAVNCLRRIPKNDGLRKRAFQFVRNWIKRNP